MHLGILGESLQNKNRETEKMLEEVHMSKQPHK